MPWICKVCFSPVQSCSHPLARTTSSNMIPSTPGDWRLLLPLVWVKFYELFIIFWDFLSLNCLTCLEENTKWQFFYTEWMEGKGTPRKELVKRLRHQNLGGWTTLGPLSPHKVYLNYATRGILNVLRLGFSTTKAFDCAVNLKSRQGPHRSTIGLMWQMSLGDMPW